MYFIYQNNNHDCGFTCLKILLANLNKDRNYLLINNPKDNDSSYSFLDLIKYARQYSLNLIGIKVNDKSTLLKEKNFPLLLSIKVEGNNHLIYVYKIRKKYVYYLDPKNGKNKKEINELISVWDGNALIVKDYKKERIEKINTSLIKNSERLMLIFLQFLSGVTFILGVYFINKNSNIILPLLSFGLYAIFELLLRRYSIILFERIDNIDITDYQFIDKNNIFSFYQLSEKYKETLISTPIKFIYSFIIISIILILFLSNGLINLTYIILTICLVFIFVYFLYPKIKKEEEIISNVETRISNSDNKIENINKAHKFAYLLGIKTIAWKYLYIGVYLIAIILLMYITNNKNLTYIFFYLFLSICLYQNLSNLLLLKEKQEEIDLYYLKKKNYLKKNK